MTVANLVQLASALTVPYPDDQGPLSVYALTLLGMGFLCTQFKSVDTSVPKGSTSLHVFTSLATNNLQVPADTLTIATEHKFGGPGYAKSLNLIMETGDFTTYQSWIHELMSTYTLTEQKPEIGYFFRGPSSTPGSVFTAVPIRKNDSTSVSGVITMQVSSPVRFQCSLSYH